MTPDLPAPPPWVPPPPDGPVVPWRVECGACGPVDLAHEDYAAQLNHSDAGWECPRCRGPAGFDNAWYDSWSDPHTLFQELTPMVPTSDLPLVLAAAELAHAAHRPQTRDGGEPYLTHCLRVARSVADVLADAPAALYEPYTLGEVVAAALCHDVIEDAQPRAVWDAAVRDRLGGAVYGLVLQLTNPSAALPREAPAADKLVLDCAHFADPERFEVVARVVKLLDGTDNLSDLGGWGKKQILKYADKCSFKCAVLRDGLLASARYRQVGPAAMDRVFDPLFADYARAVGAARCRAVEM